MKANRYQTLHAQSKHTYVKRTRQLVLHQLRTRFAVVGINNCNTLVRGS